MIEAVRSLARKHPRLYLTGYVTGGLMLVALLVWAFAVLADEVPEHGWMVRLDDIIMGFIEARNTERGERFFAAVSLLGGPLLIVLVTVATIFLAMRRDWLRAGLIVVGVAFGVGLNSVLKQVFHRGRPEFASELIPHRSWSFPSGHAMNSLVAYGILLYLLLEQSRGDSQRRALTAVVAMVVFLIAFGRVYLGVHYLSDVIAGWLAGGAWLIICLGAYRAAQRRMLPQKA